MSSCSFKDKCSFNFRNTHNLSMCLRVCHAIRKVYLRVSIFLSPSLLHFGIRSGNNRANLSLGSPCFLLQSRAFQSQNLCRTCGLFFPARGHAADQLTKAWIVLFVPVSSEFHTAEPQRQLTERRGDWRAEMGRVQRWLTTHFIF